MGRKKSAALALLAILALALVLPGRAHAATAVDGQCAMHIGKLIRRDSKGSQYPYKTGLQSNGWHCYGQARVARSGRAGKTVLVWRSYNLTQWENTSTLLVQSTKAGITIVGCSTVGSAVKGAIAVALDSGTDGLAYPATVAAASAGGCVFGGIDLFNLLPDGPKTVNGIRLVK